MKKFFYTTALCVCFISTAALAQRAISVSDNRRGGAECSYTPLQEIIRDARSEVDLMPIIKNNVNLNAPVKCGGTVLQLAILRGNPQVVRTLLEAGADVAMPVSTEGFSIPGAPKEIPLLHFAGFYAPRQDIVRLIVSAGADVTATDENGESVLWYINQNPVLKNTEVSDEIRNKLLFAPKNMDGEGARVDPSSPSPVSGTAATNASNGGMRRIVDPRTPHLAPGQALITKTGKDTVGQIPTGTRVIAPKSAYPTREIVEPDLPVAD